MQFNKDAQKAPRLLIATLITALFTKLVNITTGLRQLAVVYPI
jgi:hypothetical protein